MDNTPQSVDEQIETLAAQLRMQVATIDHLVEAAETEADGTRVDMQVAELASLLEVLGETVRTALRAEEPQRGHESGSHEH